MANKKIVINCCNDCPFFDNKYWTYSRECVKLPEPYNVNNEYKDTILPDCPLETTDERVTE